MLGPITVPANRHLADLTRTEWAVLLPLTGVIFWFGLGSSYWTERMDTSVDLLLPISAEHMDSELPMEQHLYDERRAEQGGVTGPRGRTGAGRGSRGRRQRAPRVPGVPAPGAIPSPAPAGLPGRRALSARVPATHGAPSATPGGKP